MRARAAGLLLGFVADRMFGDPRRLHPVAAFGALANGVERQWYADSRGRGVVHTAVLVGGVVTLGALLESLACRSWARAGVTAVATWTVLGGSSLEREATAVHALLEAGDLPGARAHVHRLVGRETSGLDAAEISRAVVESVAENTSDAVVAPLVWGSLAGAPGMLGYRAANTLDAMVGYQNARYGRYGWASARLDDVVNLPGSRLTALLVLVAGPARARDAWRTWRQDAAAHPSPNAGVVEAAFAGVLGVRLGGTNVYGGRREHRVVLGNGRSADPVDIGRCVLLAQRVGVGAAVVVAAAAVKAPGLGRRPRDVPRHSARRCAG